MQQHIEFLAIAAQNGTTARGASLRATVAYALGFLAARGWNENKPEKTLGESFLRAARKEARDSGDAEETARRKVNLGKAVSLDIFNRWGDLRHELTSVGMVEEIALRAESSGATDSAKLKRWLETGNPDAESTEKTPAEKGAEVTAREQERDDGADTMLAALAGVDVSALPTVAPIAPIAPIAPTPYESAIAALATLSPADQRRAMDWLADTISRRDVAALETLAAAG